MYHYAGNNPVKYTDPNGRLIILAGWSTTAGAGTGVSCNIGYFICIPGKGEDITVGTYSIEAIGTLMGANISTGFELTIAPIADEFSDIEGFSTVVGGSGPLGPLSIGGEVGYNPTAKSEKEKLESITIAVSLTFSIPGSIPGEGHIWAANTKKIQEFNLSKLGRNCDEITQKILELVKAEKYEELLDYLQKTIESLEE